MEKCFTWNVVLAIAYVHVYTYSSRIRNKRGGLRPQRARAKRGPRGWTFPSPPFAKCAKDGAPTALVVPAGSKAWASPHPNGILARHNTGYDVPEGCLTYTPHTRHERHPTAGISTSAVRVYSQKRKPQNP